MTTATTTIIPRARALPTFAWPEDDLAGERRADLQRHDRAALADQRRRGRVGGERVREQQQQCAQEAGARIGPPTWRQ